MITKEKGIISVDGHSTRYMLDLLKVRHCKDVFIPECKNGETWGARDLLKLDAWVMRRSYTQFATIGYEIKRTRADFENDQKWTKYVDLCHEFYFVCPAGLIRSADIPSRVGLMWVSTSGKLRTKRKSEWIEPSQDKLMGILIYALMSRSNIIANMNETNGEPKTSDYLETMWDMVVVANDKKELAAFVKGHIRRIYEDTRSKDSNMQYREFEVKKFTDRLADLGIIWNSEDMNWATNQQVLKEIDILGRNLSEFTLQKMEGMGRRLMETVSEIRKVRTINKNNLEKQS